MANQSLNSSTFEPRSVSYLHSAILLQTSQWVLRTSGIHMALHVSNVFYNFLLLIIPSLQLVSVYSMLSAITVVKKNKQEIHLCFAGQRHLDIPVSHIGRWLSGAVLFFAKPPMAGTVLFTVDQSLINTLLKWREKPQYHLQCKQSSFTFYQVLQQIK